MGLMPYSGTLGGAFFSMMIFGVGIALVVPAMNTAIFAVTPRVSHGAASGINNAAARAATLFAIAGYGAAAAYAFRQAAGPQARLKGYGAGDALTGPAGENYRFAIAESFELLAWISIGCAALAVIAAAFFIEKNVMRLPRSERGHAHAGVRRVYGANVEESAASDEGSAEEEDEEGGRRAQAYYRP